MYIISSCLLGNNCKYDGGNNFNEEVANFCEKQRYVLVCPEELGGLDTPRPPAEYVNDKIIDVNGRDVTDFFVRGAKLSWEKACVQSKIQGEKIEGAILKAKSPSCGSNVIYDGNFNGTLVPRDGCFTKILKSNGIKVISEKEFKNGKF